MIALDSDFIIDLFRKKENAVRKYEKIKDQRLVATQINFFEVLSGTYSKKVLAQNEENNTLNFFDNLTIFSLNRESILRAAKISGNLILDGFTIQPGDCLIAGILQAEGCNKIITRNESHFSRIKGLRVIGY